MSMLDKTCKDFVEVLASKAAVPGGGGAAAMGGAIGMALSNMVGTLLHIISILHALNPFPFIPLPPFWLT